MKSQKLGIRTLKPEILNISSNGIWLLIRKREYFLSYENFPWFKDAKVGQIHDVELRHNHYLHWDDLDVDLELQSLDNLEQYPVRYH